LVSNPEVSPDQVDSEFGPFTENLKWNLIRNKLISKYNIDIGVEQIKDVFKAQITSYFGANVDQNAPFVTETIDRMMQNKEQVEKVYQDLLFDQLYESMEAEITIDPKPIELEAFEKLLADEQNKNKVAELVGSEEE
jgi:trigger factor